MGTDLLQTLQILTELALHVVGENLRVLSVDDVALSVEEPGWDLVLGRVLDDGHDALEFFGGDFSGAVVIHSLVLLSSISFVWVGWMDRFGRWMDGWVDVPLGEVDIGLLADQVGVTTSNTLDLSQGVHDILLAIDVGVQQPEDVLEVRLLACHERCSIFQSIGQSCFFNSNLHRTRNGTRYVHMMGDSKLVAWGEVRLV